MWVLNMLLNNYWVKEELRDQKYIETNENDNTTYQNLEDTVKAVLGGNFIALQAYLHKQEKSPITQSKVQSQQKEGNNKNQNRNKQKQNRNKLMTQKAGSLKINKTEKPLARLAKEKREKTPINKNRN